jgi:hypothetical protein
MQSFLSYFFILLFVFQSLSSLSQPTKYSLSKHFIIKRSGDTLKEIIISQKKTDQDKVVYENTLSLKNSLEAAEVSHYFDGEDLYFSEKTENTFVFIHFYAEGIVKIGRSTLKKGEEVYWLKRGDRVTNLSKHRYSIEKILSEEIPDYADFKKTNRKQIICDYKSLGEFSSAYNVFKEPEKYVPLTYKYQNKYTFGIVAYPLIKSLLNDDSDIKFDQSNAFQLGFTVDLQYHHNFSISIRPSYYRNYFSEPSNDIFSVSNGLYINSLLTEIAINFVIYRYKAMKLKFSPGIGSIIHTNTYYKTSDIFFENKSIDVNPVGMNIFAELQYEFYKNLSLLVGINNYTLKIDKSKDTYSYNPLKNNITDIRIGLSFKL